MSNRENDKPGDNSRDIICDGCRDYILKECSIPIIYNNKQCPCSTCLVKIMCVDLCDEFDSYYPLWFNK